MMMHEPNLSTRTHASRLTALAAIMAWGTSRPLALAQYVPPARAGTPAPASGGSYGVGGGFSLERWEEDYSQPADPTARKRFFDPIKYVPLTSHPDQYPDIYLSLGGQARYRFDYFNNYTFGPGVNDEDGFHLQRYLMHADVHLGKNVRGFVQLNSSYVDGRSGGGRYGDQDQWDLQQGFFDLMTDKDNDVYALLRVGRQELIYGSERFVSPDDWRNVRRTFDGAKFSLSVPGNTIEIFWVRPVLIEKEQFNNDDDSSFVGIYNATALPNVLPAGNTKLELYGFGLFQGEESQVNALRVDRDLYTVGARLHSRPEPFDFDVEGDYQFGDYQGDNISAWSVATEAGYTVDSLALTPRANVGLDIASGSADPSHRFDQLFPPTYNYLGHLYLFARQNLVDAHAGVDLHIDQWFTLYLAQHTYWRQNASDGVYNLSGAVVRAPGGSGAEYMGTEFDASLTARFTQNLNGYIGYAHLFTGTFFEQTGASKDVDFFYVSMTLTF